MTKTVTFDALGGPDVLQITDKNIAAPSPGEVQVEIKATGLNRAELLFFGGQYLVQPKLPGAGVGVEGAGFVKAVGEGVDSVRVGDRVAILPALSMDEYGILGEVANVPASVLVPMSENQSFEDAAAFWMAHGTAYGMLVQVGGLQSNAGQTVLITGASSSVGIAAFQIARAHGAKIIATTRTQTKKQALLDAGTDHVIVTEDEDLVARTHELTDGKGADIVCDSIAGPIFEQLAEATADEGVIVLMGIQSGEPPAMPFFPILTRGITVTGFHLVFRLLNHPKRRAEAQSHLIEGWNHGTYKPLIDRVFPIDQVSDAYQHMASNTQIGKIVISVP